MLNQFRKKDVKNYVYSENDLLTVEGILEVRTSALFLTTCFLRVINSYLNFTKLFTFGKCQYLELSSV